MGTPLNHKHMSTQLSKRKKVSDETEIGDVTAVASVSTNTVGAVKADSEDDMVEDQPNADVDAAEASEEVSTPQEIPVYENFVDDPLRNDVTEPYRLENQVKLSEPTWLKDCSNRQLNTNK